MYLNDGYQTLISFAANPTVHLKEKSVTPPAIDGGDAIETTTMRNVTYRSFAPRSLKTLTESTFNAAYDPIVYDELNAMINVNQLITITMPDGSTVEFWGWLRTFTPGEHTEGEQPTAECTFNCSNEDDTGALVDPVYTPPV